MKSSMRWVGDGAVALLILCACTLAGALLSAWLEPASLMMVYMVGATAVAVRSGMRTAVAFVVGSAVVYDLVFLEPQWVLAKLEREHYLTFGLMLGVGCLISSLAASLREKTLEVEARARRDALVTMEAETERLRSTLLAAISHDFRTPITTIIGSVTTLLEQGGSLDRAQHDTLLGGVLREASRVHQLMSNVLDLTRIEDGAVAPRFEWCPLEELVAAVLRPLEPRLAAYEFNARFDPDGLLWCDPGLMEQLLGNLLGNACEHAPPGSAITLEIVAADQALSLTVSDTGPGFPSGREQEMVKKFSRGCSDSGSGAGPGTGLGLAICAAIARLHGAELELANRGGAWVQLRVPQPLPMAEPDEALL